MSITTGQEQRHITFQDLHQNMMRVFFFLWEYEDTCNLIILSNINISERTSAEYMLTKKDYFVLSI